MGIKFFRIVGGFSYILAALALSIAIIAALASGSAWLTGVDDDISTPDIVVQEYKESLSHNNEPDHAPRHEDTTATDTSQWQDTTQIRIDKLCALIDEYAINTSQNGVNRDGLSNWLYQTTESLGDDQYLVFLDALIVSVESGLTAPARNKDLTALMLDSPNTNSAQPAYISWDKYLEWFTGTYLEHHQEELQRIAHERSQQMQERSGAIATLIAAGMAFAVFVFATVILLLVRIEANTRQE